jgi:transposase-like protein
MDTSTLGMNGPRSGVHAPRTRPPYPPEFRVEAVRPIRASGKLVRGVPQDLGVSEQALRNAYDNAVTESVFATLHTRPGGPQDQLRSG